MQLYEVGKLFKEGVTNYQEGTEFDFNQGGAVTLLFFNSPTENKIMNVRKGKLSIGIYYRSEIIFMLYKFGALEWMDMPYSVHLSQDFTFDEIEPGMGYGNHILLIDASTGIIQAQRYVGWSEKLSRRFRSYVEAQNEKSFDSEIYNMKLNEIYKNYSTRELVNYANYIEKK